jgi:hypothetical protein
MKNLITTDLGGHPVYFKDFEFVQEQIRELVSASFGHLDSTIVTVLNGCEVTISTDGYTIEVTEGWAYYDGEMFYIPAQSATGSSPNVAKWRISESWDSRGLKTFRSETVGDKNVYQVRQLQIGYYASASEGVLFSSTVLPTRETDWASISIQSPFSGTLRYRKNLFGHLEIQGVVDNGSNNHLIGILPEGFRPSSTLRIGVPVLSGTGFGHLEINASGEITYYSVAYIYPLSIYVNNTVFLSTT